MVTALSPWIPMLACWLLACAPDELAVGSVDTEPGSAETGDAAVAFEPVQNVVFILVDTLRADHLGVYGYARDTSPVLNALAADAQVFERYRSQSAYTISSVSSLFTSLHPSAHGCCENFLSKTGDEPESPVNMDLRLATLAERFDGAGYDTAALYKTNVFNREGVDQGFDVFTQVAGDDTALESAAQLTDAAVEYLGEDRNEPFFLYLHYMDPHAAYVAPEPYREVFDEGYDSTLEGQQHELKAVQAEYGTLYDDEDVQRLIALYDGEIRYLDSNLGRLWDALEPHLEHTAVVFVGDHGEGFYDHEVMGHDNMYEEHLAVPLLIWVPGVDGARRTGRVEGIDLAPTLAGLAGLEPEVSWLGRDLSASLHSGERIEDPEFVFTEFKAKQAIYRNDGLKLILNDGPAMLFDVDADPGELVDLAGGRPDDVDAMRSKAEELLLVAEGLYEAMREE